MQKAPKAAKWFFQFIPHLGGLKNLWKNMAFKDKHIYHADCILAGLVFQAVLLAHCAKEGTGMKRTLGIITILALAAGIATNAAAKTERKDQPKARFVKETLETLGETHFPEKIKIKRITSIEVGETYYHVYEGELDKTGYHIIVFDNKRNYLGYYKSDFPPTNYQIDGSIVIDPGTVDDDGEALYFSIPIDEQKGLPPRLQIGGMPTEFVKSPTYDEAIKGATGGGTAAEGSAAKKAEDGEEEIVPEFRTWTIAFKGKPVEARAIFVKREKNEVFLRLEATGKEKGFPLHTLSKADQEYVKQFK